MKRILKGREELNKSISKSVIGDVSGAYGVGNLDQYFLYLLSLRAILRGGDENREIILPNADVKIQYNLRKFRNDLVCILDLEDSQILTGDFKKLSKPSERSPYMKTPYYFDETNYIDKIIKNLEKVRYLGDKVGLADFLIKNGFSKFLPDNTFLFTKGNNFEKVINEAKKRFFNKQSFIIKAGEGASGENMLLAKFNKNKVLIYHHGTIKGKEIKNINELIEEIDIAIPVSQRTKKGKVTQRGYDKNAILEQYYLIQDLIDISKYDEKSINFFIGEEICPTTFGTNIAFGGVHKGNIEEKLPLGLLNKFMPVLKKIREYGYYGPIGFDFFLKKGSLDIKIIEANTRFTAPISPSMLVYKLEKQNKIPKGWTWKLIQKFDTSIDLTTVKKLKQYNLVESLLKEQDIKTPKFLAYSPVFSNKYQSVIILGPDQKTISDLEDKIYSIIGGNDN